MIESTRDDDRVIASIDAAGRDRRRWPDALAHIARRLDTTFAALIFDDRASTLPELRYSTDANGAWLVEYLRNRPKLAPLRARVLCKTGVGRVYSSADFVSPERFRNSAFFQRWMEPYGLADIVGAVIDQSRKGACIFVALRAARAGPVDAQTKETLSKFLPYLARAAHPNPDESDLIRRLTDLFNCLATPIILLDRDMGVSYLNQGAERMLERHPALSVSDGALAVTDPRAREALQAALSAGASARADSLAIMLKSGEERCCVVHVLPFPQGGGALFVRSFSLGVDADAGVASALYGLTARETSVLLSITEVGGVPATARALGLSEGTVKGYLKSIFQKTGATRQADLVKLVMALESPFSPPFEPASLEAPSRKASGRR
jgi:DNA-binding CsgD family transcriptional regulator